MTASRDLLRDWEPPWFGFWRRDRTDAPGLPLLEEIVDADWRPADLGEIVSYLERSPTVLTSTFDDEPCHLCGDAGSDPGAYKYDGQWLWPVDLGHWVERHSVRLPDELVRRIRAADHEPPRLSDLDEIDPDDLPLPRIFSRPDPA